MAAPRNLDARLAALLDRLRRRVRRYVVWDSLLAIAAVVLTAFWLGLALDYLPVWLGGTEMPRLARIILLLVVAAAVTVILVAMLIGRLLRPLPDDSLALLVERHHPELGGRLVTAVQLNQPGREGDFHSPKLLEKVHAEAVAAIAGVEPGRVFRWQPILHKALVVAPLALLTLGLVVLSPAAFARAASRLALLSDEPWPRRAQLEMIGVELPVVSAREDALQATRLIEFGDRQMRLPRGSNGTLRIRALADGAELPTVCTVHFVTESGTRIQANMRRIGRVVDGYQAFVVDGPPLTGLAESLSLSVRGLDARLEDYVIEAVPPPALTDINLQIRYPDYLRSPGSGPIDLEVAYQAGLRIREGSDVELQATASVPLAPSEVLIQTEAGDYHSVPVQYAQDGYGLSVPLPNFVAPASISIVPRDRDAITAGAPYRYFLGVIVDQPPELNVRLDAIGSAVTPIAKLPVQAEVQDDYGVRDLTVTVSVAQTGAPDGQPAPSLSLSPSIGREGSTAAEVDLRDAVAAGQLPEIQEGQAINLLVEASDHYDLQGQQHVTRSQVFRLDVVSPADLLALMERRELALRARLEQTIDETRSLRDALDLMRRQSFNTGESPDADPARGRQLRLLRIQQSGLQASKTAEELTGIAVSLDDMLREMVHNRIDSVDRRERIGVGVRDPLRQVVQGPGQRLIEQIQQVERDIDDLAAARTQTAAAVETTEQVLLQLTAVLERMLDLESYNEILDLVRELIDDQEELLEETKKQRKQKVLELFE